MATNYYVSPVCSGIYRAVINKVTYKEINTSKGNANAVLFNFDVETNDGWVPVTSLMFESEYENSRYQQLVFQIAERFGVEEFYFEDHIGVELTMQISLRSNNGNSYVNIDWYEPYEV